MEPIRTEVLQGEWQSLEHEGILSTKGIATCIGISLYDHTAKRAMLGHFDSSSLSDGTFGVMIQEAHQTFSTPEETKIWIGGGALLDPEEVMRCNPDLDTDLITFTNDETQHFRDTVSASVEDFAQQGAALTNFWLQGTVYYNYALNVATGEEDVVHRPDII